MCWSLSGASWAGLSSIHARSRIIRQVRTCSIARRKTAVLDVELGTPRSAARPGIETDDLSYGALDSRKPPTPAGNTCDCSGGGFSGHHLYNSCSAGEELIAVLHHNHEVTCAASVTFDAPAGAPRGAPSAPYEGGRSRQGLPVRAIHRTASTNRRLSSPLRPGSPACQDKAAPSSPIGRQSKRIGPSIA
jgi:hypothetical protein